MTLKTTKEQRAEWLADAGQSYPKEASRIRSLIADIAELLLYRDNYEQLKARLDGVYGALTDSGVVVRMDDPGNRYAN